MKVRSAILTSLVIALILLFGGSQTKSWAQGETPSAPPASIAVFGDSLTTGGGVHPNLVFDTRSIWDVFTRKISVTPVAAHIPDADKLGLKDPLSAPRRLWPARREFDKGDVWLQRHLLHGYSRTYLDTAEYTWGYQLAAGLGVPSDQLLIAAEDGARVLALSRHIDRVLEATNGVLPAKAFIFYTGNDLCAPAIGLVTSASDYGSMLTRSLRYMVRNAAAPASGSDVYVMSYLGVLQLLHSEAILEKKISAFGEQVTCRQLRQNLHRPSKPEEYNPGLPEQAWYFGLFAPPNLSNICPTLFAPHAAGEIVSALANRIREYRLEQQAAVNAANRYAQESYPEKKIRFHYIPDTAEIIFAADDIGGDCFHLSPAGQAKLARTVQGYLSREGQQPR